MKKYLNYGLILLLAILILPNNSYAERVKPNLSKLHEAVFYGKNNLVEFYAKNGGNINILAGNDNTPLHLAAFRGKKEAVKILLKYGADASLKNKQGMTALDLANLQGYQEIVDILKNHKAKVTAP